MDPSRDAKRNGLGVGQMLNLITLRALKGAPLSILIAMFLAKQPVGESWLISVTGYSQNTIRKGCNFLLETQMIQRNGRYHGYVLSKDAMQLPLGMAELGESQNLTLPTATTTSTLNKYEDEFSEEKAVVEISKSKMTLIGEKLRRSLEERSSTENDSRLETQLAGELLEEQTYPDSSFQVTENDPLLVILYSAGIMEPTASRLLEKDWVTKDYLEAHIDKANRENTPIPLLIHRIQSHDPKPRRDYETPMHTEGPGNPPVNLF